MSRSQRALLGLGAFLMSGCYTYSAVERPQPGSMVRVRVPIQSALTGQTGDPGTASIEGRVISAGDTLALATRTRHALGPYRELIAVDTIRVSRDALASLEVQQFSTRQSVLLGVVVAGAVTGLALVTFAGLWGGGGTDPPIPPPQPSVVGSLVLGLLRAVVR